MAKNHVSTEKMSKKKNNFVKNSYSKFKSTKAQQVNAKNIIKEIKGNEGDNNIFVKPINRESSNQQTSEKHNLANCESKDGKKPFDKKKYRLQKYSKKYKLQQWEEKRKKSVLRNYYKTLNDIEPNSVTKISGKSGKRVDTDTPSTSKEQEKNSNSDNSNCKHSSTADNESGFKNKLVASAKEIKSKSFRKAHEEYQRIKDEQERKKELQLNKTKEKEEALQQYKKKKKEKMKKLNRKTKRGQPIMKHRIEMLLEKIQNSVN